MSYIFEGRVDATSDWVLIHQGDLPWKNDISFPRNRIPGLDISSTYMSADNSFVSTEVSFYDYDYQICGSPSLQHDYRGFNSNTKSNHTVKNGRLSLRMAIHTLSITTQMQVWEGSAITTVGIQTTKLEGLGVIPLTRL